jgi:hypothetical protein
MRSISIRGSAAVAVVVGALVAPAGALAAAPAVTTGGVANITPTTALLKGSVDPNGTATSYMFQIGPTRLYGGSTTPGNAGGGNKPVAVASPVSGLAPATTYHYRLVGIRGSNTFFGKDRTFKSKRQPLGVSLAATPNPIRIGGATTLAGILSGTGNSGRQVVLQANAWPYTGGFIAAANPQVTNASGAFSFPLLSVSVNTQYRVQMVARPDVVSPIVVLGTTNKVTRHAKVRRGSRRGRIHFWGTIRPAVDGSAVFVQKLRRGAWVNIGQTSARATPRNLSRYSKRIRQKHGGKYRIVAVDASGAHSGGVSRIVERHHLRF